MQMNLTELNAFLPKVIISFARILLLGAPGTGKTTAARIAAQESSRPYEFLNGGSERDWKQIFPYRLPGGGEDLGKAQRAHNGVLVIDEVNRCPAEMKTDFNLFGADGSVPLIAGGLAKVECAIIATANPEDLGVEEMSSAEADRYDFIIDVVPTDEEVCNIIVQNTKQSERVVRAIWDNVKKLRESLDKGKFYSPAGIRLAQSIAKGIGLELKPVDAFKSAAKRCFPTGRRGAERFRGEFDSVVGEIAERFANAMMRAGQEEKQEQESKEDEQTAYLLLQCQNLDDLAHSIFEAPDQIETNELRVIASKGKLIAAAIKAFGLGVGKSFSNAFRAGKKVNASGVQLNCEYHGCRMKFTGRNKDEVIHFLRELGILS